MNKSEKKNSRTSKTQKKFNKLWVLIPSFALLLALLVTGIVFFIPRDNTSFSYECFRLRFAVSGFLGDVIDGDFSEAAQSVYFVSAEDGTPIPTTDALCAAWAKRMTALKDGIRNIYLADYTDLIVRKENGVLSATVTLDVMLQGQTDTFSKAPYTLTVVETEEGWKIAALTEQELLTDFEKAISGVISAEELAGGDL